jgi:RNA polymerase primary sigma factor
LSKSIRKAPTPKSADFSTTRAPQQIYGSDHASDGVSEHHDDFEHEVESASDDSLSDEELEELEADRRRAGENNTDDPVRMYLMQMGQIPLLDRSEEISAAKQIEVTRFRYRNSMLATDYVLEGAVQALEQVHSGELRLDRTIEVSVTNTQEKKNIMRRLKPNLRTLRHLLRENRNDYFTAINRRQTPQRRHEAWQRLVRRRNKAVRLVEELNLRTTACNPFSTSCAKFREGCAN